MLKPWQEIGVALARTKDGGVYVCQVFGNPDTEMSGTRFWIENRTKLTLHIRPKGAKAGLTVLPGQRKEVNAREKVKEFAMELFLEGNEENLTNLAALDRGFYAVTGDSKKGLKVEEKK